MQNTLENTLRENCRSQAFILGLAWVLLLQTKTSIERYKIGKKKIRNKCTSNGQALLLSTSPLLVATRTLGGFALEKARYKISTASPWTVDLPEREKLDTDASWVKYRPRTIHIAAEFADNSPMLIAVFSSSCVTEGEGFERHS
jgi:hypothetical protein